MEKCVVKLVVFNGEDFDYWKNWTRNYLLSQGCAIWEIKQEAYAIPTMLENATQCELQKYENNYKVWNLITTALGRCMIVSVIPRSEKVGPKPLYMCLGCSIHMHSNNMIQMQCLIKHSNYSLHNDPWVMEMFTQMQRN
jgi:hypothetical protein